MGKFSKILIGVLLFMAVGCFGLYFYFSMSKTYIVKFDTDGGNTIASQEVKENELATKPADPTRGEDVFLNWMLNGKEYNFQTAVTSDINLLANWEKKYKVVAKLEENEYSIDIKENEKIDINAFNFPEHEGYTIKLYNEDGSEYDLETEVKENITLNANYIELKQYTVRFNTNSSRKLDKVLVWEGSTVAQPDFTRENYDLLGWYLNDTVYDFSTPVTSDITLTAKWTEKGKLTVTFKVDDKDYLTKSIKENAKVSKPTDPTKKGYVFTEWKLNDKTYNFNDPVTSDITLTAEFREAQTFTVKYDSNGGSKVGEKIVVEGTKLTKPTDPTRNGYVFVEWQLNGKTYNFNNPVVEDITLKALWEDDLPEFTVSFNSNGGSDVRTQYVKQNKLATKPANPLRSGYKFVRWVYDNKEYNFSTPVTSNITLVAEWEALKQFTVSFDSDGGSSVPSQTIREGEKAVMVTSVTKEGFEFVEWQLDGKKYDFNTPVVSNIMLKAIWKEKSA